MNTAENKLLNRYKIDLKQLLWAIKEWHGLISEGAIYLILDAFSIYYRTFRVLNELKKDSSIENIGNFESDFRSLQNEFIKACSVENIQKIVSQLDNAFFEYIEGKLSEVIRSSEDLILFEEDKDFPGEFSYETANDFIGLLTGILNLIKFTDENLPHLKSNELNKKFSLLEKRFKDNFYHFAYLEEQLFYQRQIFLPLDEEWWFYEKPSEYKVTYPAVFLAPLNVDIRTGECPADDKLQKFAADETYGGAKLAIENHIYECDYCFNQVFQFRSTVQQKIDKEFEGTVERVIKEQLQKPMPTYTWIKDRLVDLGQGKLMWAVAGTAGAAVKEQESGIDWYYETSPDSENAYLITLKRPDKEIGNIKSLVQIINRRNFYYKVFGIYGENDISEKHGGQRKSLPFGIKLPEGTVFSIVLIGINEDVLKQNAEKLLLWLLNPDKEKKPDISDIACIVVKPKDV